MQLIEVIDAARGLLNETLDSTRTFPDNTSSFWTDSLLITYHNLVQQELQNDIISVHEDYFVTQTNISVVANTAEYNLPSGTIKVRRVENIENSSAPVEIPPTSLNQRGMNTTLSAGGGGGYYLRGTQIIFEDTPTVTNASAIRIHIVRGIPDVSAATNSSELPVEHHGGLVWGIYKYCLIQQQSSPESLALAEREYEKRRREIKAQVENRQVQRPRSVRRTYERGYL